MLCPHVAISLALMLCGAPVPEIGTLYSIVVPRLGATAPPSVIFSGIDF